MMEDKEKKNSDKGILTEIALKWELLINRVITFEEWRKWMLAWASGYNEEIKNGIHPL